MEGQMLLFPLPVENLHAQFVWKMNSFFFFFSCFGCCTVAKFRGTILHSFGIGNLPMCLPLSYPCSKHAHVQPPICPLPWNCHGALAT